MSLLVHYKCEVDSGTLVDASGNGNDGTFGGSGTSNVVGIDENAIAFDGNGYVDINTTPPFGNNFEEDATYSCWIKTSSSSFMDIIGWGTSAESRLKIIMASGRVLFQETYWTGSTYEINSLWSSTNSAGVLNDNRWRFIVGTREKTGVLTLYIDGNYNNSISSNGLTLSNDSRVRIGGRTPWVAEAACIGSIDDIRLYDSVLSYKEVLDMYETYVHRHPILFSSAFVPGISSGIVSGSVNGA